ncbi:hypothetical protein [Pelagicoccus sp. SDUM812002]|uniref:hypothetical protein n=1 Tax=Pelagicoccus sp. SDUM812002 TaxID=3041266 RepID=UPI00280EB4E0|nr:hypothetical protein [Pelagicoccus sp. SDUM812002]MDQ8187412.1 hypothetical protein [Pelagicoccus sp. SDUM812002]
MKYPLLLSLLLAFTTIGLPSFAQESQSDESDAEESKAEEGNKEKTIAELTEESDLSEGLFDFYRDRKTGKVRLLLTEDDLDKEYLYFSYVENGVAEADWAIRGAYKIQTAKVFEIRRFFDQIEFVEKNTSYYFDSEKAISRASNANVSDSVFYQAKIEQEDEETKELLLDVDGLFLGESFYQFSPAPDPDKKPHEVFSMGKLSKEK